MFIVERRTGDAANRVCIRRENMERKRAGEWVSGSLDDEMNLR